MNVLSLFDGISCGQYVLRKKLNLKINNYFASEISEKPMLTSMFHFPSTIQLGDVTKIDVGKLPKIDLLIGGSPCQGFSFSGKLLAFDDPRSNLFFEYVKILRALRAKNPKIKFLLENVVMPPQHVDVITKFLECAPIFINSRIFSPQSRRRLYWTNIPLEEFPEPSKKVLIDIVDPPFYTGDVLKENAHSREWGQNRIVRTLMSKTPTITASQNAINIPLNLTRSRKATVIELERLAGLPDDYTKPCGIASARLHAIGNGWECNTIAFIFKHLK